MNQLSGYELSENIRAGKLSSVEATEAALAKIDAADERVRAFVTVDPEKARARAKSIDERVQRGEEVGPLAGIPMAVKDNMCVRGMPTTCSSRILENFRPPYDAHVTECLARAGAVILGKTNLDEFAMGSSTENSGFFTTRNPWNLDCAPGGSSGGSAAAVAAGMVPLSLGSDTGGSIRQPASFCGVVGMKPTYGRVSRFGLVAFASSLDQIGPFARDARDAALLLQVISGHDQRDSTSAKRKVPDFVKEMQGPVSGLRIGLLSEFMGEGLDEEVRTAVLSAVKTLRSLGAEVKDVSLPHSEYSVATYYLVATAEASSNLARYDGVHYGYRKPEANDIVEMYSASREAGLGPEVKRRIMLGTYALSAGFYDAYFTKASKVRTLIRQDFDRAFEQVDCILCPTTPTPAFRIGEKVDDPLAMYLSDIYTISLNLAGLPGISVPCGLSSCGLPIGMQVLGRAWEESTVLQVAHAYQQATDHHLEGPEI